MGIIAWILLGLASQRLLPGWSARRLVLSSAAGVSGALLGGWVAVSVFHAQALSTFFSIPAWLAALTGAAVFLLASRTLAGGPAQPRRRGKGAPVPVPVTVRRRDVSR
jgi:uncharacterized membrane protein YeaQ/YmgE (transglycosylase-associated protein family)